MFMHGNIYPLDTKWGTIIDIMTETGWSWPEIASTPYDLVMEMAEHISQKRRWRSRKIQLEESKRK